MPATEEVTFDDIVATRERIAPHIHRTPVLTSRALNRRSDAEVFLKCENFQRAGAFKIRGAMNFLSRLSEEERARGVVTHSSGNHAQAVALAARTFGAKAHIVMPETAPRVKVDATRAYGAEVTLCAANMLAREAAAAEIEARTGAVLVHPYDHPWTIMGQGTACLELLEDVPALDLIVAPVSGGGLLSGTAIAAAGWHTPVCTLGAEPELARDTYDSLAAGHVVVREPGPTMCDGLKANICERTLAIIQALVDRVLLVTEEEIREATYFVWERVKIVCEPSCAAAVAPLLFHRSQVPGARIGVIISGGNVDLRGVLD